MPQFNLKNGETEKIDIGNSVGVSANNVSSKKAIFYIDYYADGNWHPITGAITLRPGETRAWTRQDLGHENIRIGAEGLDDGTVIIQGQY